MGTLKRVFLHPLPAAGPITALLAVLTVVLFFQRTGRETASRDVRPAIVPLPSAAVGEVTILRNRSSDPNPPGTAAPEGTLLGAGPAEDGQAPIIRSDSRNFLFLEMNTPQMPRDSSALYLVEITPESEETPSWAQNIPGGAFAGTHALGILLEGGKLQPGTYQVSVCAPSGEPVFNSPLRVR